jgi:hypothetical protein
MKSGFGSLTLSSKKSVGNFFLEEVWKPHFSKGFLFSHGEISSFSLGKMNNP